MNNKDIKGITAAVAVDGWVGEEAPVEEKPTSRSIFFDAAWVKGEDGVLRIDTQKGLDAFAAHIRAEQQQEIEKLKREADRLMERSVLAMAIAEGDEGWQNAPVDCPMLEAVMRLRQKYQMLSDLYRPTIQELDSASEKDERIKVLEEALRESREEHKIVAAHCSTLQVGLRNAALAMMKSIDAALTSIPHKEPNE